MVFLFLSWSCSSSYQKIVKSSDPGLKFLKANEYYEKGDCVKAIPLFEELIPVYKGTKSIDDIYYQYADCHFRQGEYLVASFHFKNIYDSYPNSEYSEESLYMYSYCYYMMSPEIQLDQTYTEKGMMALQLFINAFPKSKRIDECNMLIDNLRKKLETKAFRNAGLYLKTGHYRAAANSYQQLLRNYPDTRFAEEASFLVVKSYYLYASNSIPSKQMERFLSAEEAYKDFTYMYRESKFMKEASQIHESTVTSIEKLKN